MARATSPIVWNDSVGAGGVAGQECLPGLGVQGDHADVVGGDVVQLACDAHPLLGDRPLGLGLALTFEAPARAASSWA